jgi:hypothetical protein
MEFHPSLNQFALIHKCLQGTDGINISLKNCKRAFIGAYVEQLLDATRETVTLQQSSGNAGAAAGTGEKALSTAPPLWYNEDCALSNLLTKGTAAVSYQFDANTSKSKIVWWEILPQQCMDVANGFDCIVANGSGAHATTKLTIFAILDAAHGPMPTVYAD